MEEIYNYLVITYPFSVPLSEVERRTEWLLRTESFPHQYLSADHDLLLYNLMTSYQ